MTDYKFDEDRLLQELRDHIDNTYNGPYSNNFQTAEVIVANGHGTGFFLGSIWKYVQRYGKKGEPADWRRDLFKTAHFALMQISSHDRGTAGK